MVLCSQTTLTSVLPFLHMINNSKEWCLFIVELKVNGNLYGAVLSEHSVCEKHGNIVSELLQYHKHDWIICVDLKMVCFLLCQ